MIQKRICCPGGSSAIQYAAQYLSSLGFQLSPEPDADAAHLLLPTPSFPACEEYIEAVLKDLPNNILISGGNLNERLNSYRTVDFLKDPFYLATNAAITAECAVQIIEDLVCTTLLNCPILIIGWGRIGKCLQRLLARAGADVTVAARKPADLAMIRALGSRSIPVSEIQEELTHYTAVLNTVPEMLLPDMEVTPGCIALELASSPGMAGENIINGRGLPGKMAPEKSGELIAKTFIRLSLGKEV